MVKVVERNIQKLILAEELVVHNEYDNLFRNACFMRTEAKSTLHI